VTSGAKADGRFGKQDFVYLPTEDVYRCPAGEKLTYRFTGEEAGKMLRHYWTTACPTCPLKSQSRRVFAQPRPTAVIGGSGLLRRKLTIDPISLVANSCFDGLN
jgi:hypothetical protein